MEKEVKFSLVFRDMWQSAGKYQPRVDQLVKIAPAIIRMGCFDRVETNGGGFEQVNLLYGENPNKSVRQWTKPFHEAGMVAQASLCITHSPIHTVEYYVNLAKTFIEAGADEICLKDMAGIGRPS